MSKYHESAAERLWKEKLDMGVTVKEAVVMLVLAVALAGFLLLFSM